MPMTYSTQKHAQIVQFRSPNISDVVYDQVRFEHGEAIHGGGITQLSEHRAKALHHHNALEVGYCHDGYGIFMVGASVYNFRPGDVSVIHTGVPHMHISDSGSRWSFLFIDPYKFDAGKLTNPTCRTILRQDENPEISTIACELFAEIDEAKRASSKPHRVSSPHSSASFDACRRRKRLSPSARRICASPRRSASPPSATQ
jgi:quercetin dioxygenase-like cupin family protein